jgi:hypothetical protein
LGKLNIGNVMYTDNMQRAFRSITPPRGFAVDIIDNEHFLTVRANEKQFMRLDEFEKRRAFEYMMKVKKALEDNGAVVMLVKDAVK